VPCSRHGPASRRAAAVRPRRLRRHRPAPGGDARAVAAARRDAGRTRRARRGTRS
jgi:hypothetical protein